MSDFRLELFDRSVCITTYREYINVEIHRETTYYSTEPTLWKDIIAFFCGGYRVDREYEKGYYFPSDDAMLHFALLIGERDTEKASWYYKYYEFRELMKQNYDPYADIPF